MLQMFILPEKLAHGLLFFGAHGRAFADLDLNLDDGLVAA
jgi:hypothetical protein